MVRKSRNKQKDSSPSPEYQEKPPIWKAVIIQFLRGTIGLLENTVVKLETQANSSTSKEKKPNFLQRIFLGWDKFLMTFRLFLLSNVSNNLSDLAITIILGIVTLMIVTVTVFFSTSQNTEIATVTPSEEIPQPQPTPTSKSEPEIKSEIGEPTKSKPESEVKPEIELTPTSEKETEIKPEIIETPISKSEPEIKSEIQEPIESKPEPESKPEIQESTKSESESEINLEIAETAISKPEPEIKLTPEQELIASIKNQLSEITVTIENQEDEEISLNLIKSIQANFPTSDLIITIKDDWYNLEKTKQQQFAAEILQRSQDLDFTHLQIMDSHETLIARSPVVGNEMLIFR